MKEQKVYYYLYNFSSGGWNYEVTRTIAEARKQAKKRFPNSDIDLKSFRKISYDNLQSLIFETR